MAGSPKFAAGLIDRDDIACLTREAADSSGIQHIMDVDKRAVEEISATPDTGKRRSTVHRRPS
jgi:hypothetical protein